MRIAIVTNCTNRKAEPPAAGCSVSSIPLRTAPAFLKKWRERIKAAPKSARAIDLYQGRGFAEIKLAWAAANASFDHADVFIASAGLGLVAGVERIPSYSIAASPRGEDSILLRLGLGDASEWWAGLTKGRRGLAARCREADLIVIALSAPYLSMLRHELREAVERFPDRVRIISRTDPSRVDSALGPAWLPYDERLNGPDTPIAGAESDFAQRALRHFIEHVLVKAPRADAASHRRRVRTLLSKMKAPRRLERRRLTDDEIKNLMRRIGPNVGAARMLRVLRDEKSIACEQSRCAALYKEVFPKVRIERAAA